jgi:hypothetical protein
VLHEYWQEIGSPDDAGFLIHGCFAALHVALAREDRSLAASSSAALDRLLSPRTRLNRRALLEGYLQDDPEPQRVTPAESWWWGPSPSAIFHIMFLNDRGISLPSDTLAVVLPAGRAARIAHLSETLAAAEAISLQDAARLRKAIGELDALGLRPHAARSRIVLAQMTGEAEPLAEARPVLQSLGDRWAIKRLDEVAERMG